MTATLLLSRAGVGASFVDDVPERNDIPVAHDETTGSTGTLEQSQTTVQG